MTTTSAPRVASVAAAMPPHLSLEICRECKRRTRRRRSDGTRAEAAPRAPEAPSPDLRRTPTRVRAPADEAVVRLVPDEARGGRNDPLAALEAQAVGDPVVGEDARRAVRLEESDQRPDNGRHANLLCGERYEGALLV